VTKTFEENLKKHFLRAEILDDNNEEMNDIIVQFGKILDEATYSKVIKKIK